MEEKNKLQQEIIKADMKTVEKLWKNIDEDFSLETLLNKMTKDELVKVAKRYSLKGMTTLKKADAVEKLKNTILENYENALDIVPEEIINFLISLVESNGLKEYECQDLIYSNYLRNRGLVFTGTVKDELYIILPNEISVLINDNKLKDLKEKSKVTGEFIKAIAGMTYYYGVIDVTEIKVIIERLFTTSITEEYIKSLILNGEELGYDYIIEGEEIYHIDVEDVEAIKKLQVKQEQDYYKFDKKSLIKAGRPDFMEENKQGEKLEKAIGELFVIDKDILKEEIDNFIIAVKNELSRDEAIESFLEAYEIESDEERSIFVEELMIFANSIRRWSLKGYTEDEIIKSAQRVVNEIKIGRNDPCICGSGKKYKKCCGK